MFQWLNSLNKNGNPDYQRYNFRSNVFSDKLYNELFNGKSSSGGARLGF